MLRFIVAKSLKFRFLVLAIAVGMMAFGLTQFDRMPVDVFPEFAPPLVEVQTPSLGLAASEVEALVTVPLEEALAGMPNLATMRSKSVPDLSAIKLYFERGTDLLDARQLVQERLAMVIPTLPSWSSPPVLVPPLSATSRMMKIGIKSDTLSVIDLSMITYWTIRQRLLRVQGVANVAIWGERLEMLQVQADPARMRKHDVSLDDILEVTSDALDVGLYSSSEGHHVGTGGWIETPNQRIPIRHHLPYVYDPENVTPDHLANTVIEVRDDGTPLLLKDVADVIVDHQPMIGDAIIDDGIGLLLIVEKFPWGNTLQVTRDVEAALDAMRPGLPDMEIDHEIFRPATYIEMSMQNLGAALVVASILVVMILFVFLNEWRVALISCTAIPLSLMTGALVLYAREATINTMVLAGFIIALGAVVDDAIVDVENILRRLRENRKKSAGRLGLGRIVVEASFEVRKAILFSTAIEIMVLVPVFFMEGLSGAFFRPLAISYALAIAASTIVALTLTPALSFMLLRKAPLERRESVLVRALHRGYDGLLARIVRSPGPAYVTVAIIAAAGVLVVPRLGQELLPSFKERDFLMHWLTKPGTSWPEMNRITIQGSKELRQIPGVRNFGASLRRLRRDAEHDPGHGRRLPRALPRRAHLPEGADPRGPDGHERCHRGADLRSGSPHPPREGLGAQGGDGEDRGHRGSARGTPREHPAGRDQGRPGHGVGLWPQAGRRTPRRRQARGGPGGRRHPHRQPHLRRADLEHPGDAPQPDQSAGAPHSLPGRRRGPPVGGGRRTHRSDPQRDRARAPEAQDRRQRQRAGAGSRLGLRGRQRRHGQGRLPGRVPPGAPG
jgi:Cu/Ag efflux pump CusA